ncbi:GTP-binding protein [Roseovarius atlanticus]|nr:GTP-binding protein [Roseovarius atlanticus]MBY6124973.1 GTP-binding protein [Roseovarius atlanticus]MBY6150566.1 GTP-binding protein [Roseovarius atlanticus]
MATETSDDRIPVTLLTGFLGSGKTTLLNTLIRDPDAGRIAVVMNEFGDVGLDHDLIEEATEETVLMQSGCICCTIRSDLVETMRALLDKRQGGDLAFDRVVIETTGIADPGPILHTLVMDQQLAPSFRMDGVVTLADAAVGPRTLDTQFEAVHQIAMADLVVVTKTDLVTPHEVTRFEARIEGLNATARRIHAEHGRTPPGALFGLSALRPSVTSGDISDWLGTEPSKPDPFAGLSGFARKSSKPASLPFGQAGHHAPHDHRISSASIEVEDPIPAGIFDFWLDTLIAIKGPDILRIKGILHVEGLELPFVFHGVQHIFDTPVQVRSWSGTDTTSRVVVIARDTDAKGLQKSLEILRTRPKEDGSDADGMMVHTTGMPF